MERSASDRLKAINTPEIEPSRPLGSLSAGERAEIATMIGKELAHVRCVQKPPVGLDAI